MWNAGNMGMAQAKELMKVEKLDALTSLRFFAALLIVVHHSKGLFGIGTNINDYLPTYQAVSFFFVLSGFILTYVYKSFETKTDIRKFYVARVARIWPLHCVTLMITFFLFHRNDTPIALGSERAFEFYSAFIANFFMVQAWIPIKEYFWSFNAVSWSISTELAFYLCFPFLLLKLRTNWKMKLLFTFFLSVAIVVVSSVMMLSDGNGPEIGLLGVVNINPLARIFEFTVGMCAAVFYDRVKTNYRPSLVYATLFEAIIVCAVVGGMALNQPMQSMVEPFCGKAATAYIDNGVLHSFTFAIMILLFSQEKGRISQLLSKRIFVLLGEMSFSVYLLHQIMLRLYRTWIEPVDTLPGFLSYIYFWAILMSLSYVMLHAIEKPCRKAIIGIGQSYQPNARKYLDGFSYIKLLSALTVVLILVLPVAFFAKNAPAVQQIDQSKARAYLKNSDEGYRNVRFGESLILVAAGFHFTDDDNSIYLVWKAEKDMELSMKVAVHFVDANGEILGQADYNQSRRQHFSPKVSKDVTWLDTIKVPKEYYAKAQSVGICIYKDRPIIDIVDIVDIDKGPRDWNGKRLLIEIRKTS